MAKYDVSTYPNFGQCQTGETLTSPMESVKALILESPKCAFLILWCSKPTKIMDTKIIILSGFIWDIRRILVCGGHFDSHFGSHLDLPLNPDTWKFLNYYQWIPWLQNPTTRHQNCYSICLNKGDMKVFWSRGGHFEFLPIKNFPRGCQSGTLLICD